MTTYEDISSKAEREEKFLAEAYLKGITDFVKWSSTLAIAAILWIGNNITSVAGLSWVWWLSVVSLGFLVFSLVIAVLIVNRVLTAWGLKWVAIREWQKAILLKKEAEEEPSKVTDQELTTQHRQSLKTAIATVPLSQPAGFNTWVSWHIVLLIAGLVIYALAQILSAL
jgi:hypothetical protein